MFLIVESGSTKADWMFIDKTSESYFTSIGFNPNFHTKATILEHLQGHPEVIQIAERVEQLHFYGAGCSTPQGVQLIKDGFGAVFPHATMTIETDLVACARATYNEKPQISCVLGTGSNACVHKGEGIHQEAPSLGYILGDEASGAYYGKQLLRDYFYNRLPSELRIELNVLGISRNEVIHRVYNRPQANAYLASFAKILIDNKGLEYSKKLISKGLNDFFDIHIMCYDNYKEYELNFVGSIAYHLQEELQAMASERGLEIGRIIQRPLERLVEWHKARDFKA